MTALRDLATIVRSKNAGPYITTCDVFFRGEAEFERARDSGAITAESVARLYRLPREHVLGVHFYAPALAVKISFLKPVDGGHVFSPDIAGASQHVPLLEVDVQ
jgi:hypothetical protein